MAPSVGMIPVKKPPDNGSSKNQRFREPRYGPMAWFRLKSLTACCWSDLNLWLLLDEFMAAAG